MHSWTFLSEKWRKLIQTYIQKFIAALFLTAPSWKQCRCPSTSAWLIILWYVHPHYGIQLSNKKQPTTDRYNHLDESPKNSVEFKKVNPQKLHTKNSIYTAFLKWQNDRNGEQLTVAKG